MPWSSRCRSWRSTSSACRSEFSFSFACWHGHSTPRGRYGAISTGTLSRWRTRAAKPEPARFDAPTRLGQPRPEAPSTQGLGTARPSEHKRTRHYSRCSGDCGAAAVARRQGPGSIDGLGAQLFLGAPHIGLEVAGAGVIGACQYLLALEAGLVHLLVER